MATKRPPLDSPVVVPQNGKLTEDWRNYFSTNGYNDLIAGYRLSSSSSQIIQLGYSGEYTDIRIKLIDIVRGSSSHLGIQTSTDRGVTFSSSSGNYRWSLDYHSGAAATHTSANSSSTGTYIQLTGTSSTGNLCGDITIYTASSAATKPLFTVDTISSQVYPERVRGAGQRDSAAAINAIKIYPTAGTLTSGLILVYGTPSK
jgi:hypothetical protein